MIAVMWPSLDGRRFAPLERADAGEAGADTVFEYHEDAGVIWARYAGGSVKLGFLVGTRSGDTLSFRYCHVNDAGETANGTCASAISADADGRLVLSKAWRWESKPGNGTSLLRELR
ncbi:MAG: hypothetical protein JOY73_00690 [Actinobacteria bacterium]|nr:hypothetical protein [Actinomycetota bacterium]